jgi:hypothetical protein
MDKGRKRKGTHEDHSHTGNVVTVNAAGWIHVVVPMFAFIMHIHNHSLVFISDIANGTNEQLCAVLSSKL